MGAALPPPAAPPTQDSSPRGYTFLPQGASERPASPWALTTKPFGSRGKACSSPREPRILECLRPVSHSGPQRAPLSISVTWKGPHAKGAHMQTGQVQGTRMSSRGQADSKGPRIKRPWRV